MINAPFNKKVFIIVCGPNPAFDYDGVWCDETIHTSFDDVVKWVHEMQTEPSDIDRIIEIDLAFGTSRDVTKDVSKQVSSICDGEEPRDLIDWLDNNGHW
jgi:hypothetical protein